MTFEVLIEKRAAKALARIETRHRRRIEDRIEELGTDPRPIAATMLKGHHGTYRVRQGDYRIVYTVADDIRVVSVTDIGNRSTIYREV